MTLILKRNGVSKIVYLKMDSTLKDAFAFELTEKETNQVNTDSNYSLPENTWLYNHQSAKQTGNGLDYSSDSDNEKAVSQNSSSHWFKSPERIRMMVIRGIIFLQQHFKCTSGMHLACVALHVLHEAKQRFLSLSYSTQIDLIGKILAPRGDLERNSDEPSLEPFELNNEQKNALFISYILSVGERTHFRTLIEKFEEHDMHIPEFIPAAAYFETRSTLFSINSGGRIELVDFPPVVWMSEYLSLNSVSSFIESSSPKSPSIRKGKRFGPREISFVKLPRPTKEMNTKNISGYPQVMLDCLSEKVHDGIVCLLQNFEVFVNSGILEVVLHSVKNCAFFFGLSYFQQKEVVRASFHPFRIDGQGRVISSEAITQRKLKLTKKEKELLCISYILSQNGALHYQQVLSMFRKKIKTKDELGYFRRRQDLFFVDGKGYINLINVPAIRWHYVNFIVSEKVGTPNMLGTLSEINEIPNSDSANISQNKLVSSWSTNNNKEISRMEVDRSGQRENSCSVECLKEETKIQNETVLKRMTDRVRNAISYLSQSFVLIADADLLHLMLSVLDDVKSFYLNLTAQSREDFIKECFSCYYISSRGFILSATLSKSCMLSDEEKIELSNVYQHSQQREMHYIKSLSTYSASKSTSVNIVKEKEVTKRSTHLKSGASDIKTNEGKHFGETKAEVQTVPQPIIQLHGNLPSPRGTTNLCKSYLEENYNADVRAMSALKTDFSFSLHSLYSQPLFSSKCASDDIFRAADTRQKNQILNCGCVALSWTEVSIFEEDESYYNSLIHSFLANPQME